MIRGFSLIEVVVAVAIIGLIATVTSTLLQRVSVDAREIRNQDLALKIARNEIEVLRASGYASLPASGSFTNTLLSSLVSSSALVTIADFDAKTKRADVTVSWQSAGLASRSVSLSTLITQNSTLK